MGKPGREQFYKLNSDHPLAKFSMSFAGQHLAVSNSAKAVTCVPPEGLARL